MPRVAASCSGLAPSPDSLLRAGTGSSHRFPREATTEQARHAIRHGIKREEQEATVCEVLNRRPSSKQGVNKRQQDRADQRAIQDPEPPKSTSSRMKMDSWKLMKSEFRY